MKSADSYIELVHFQELKFNYIFPSLRGIRYFIKIFTEIVSDLHLALVEFIRHPTFPISNVVFMIYGTLVPKVDSSSIFLQKILQTFLSPQFRVHSSLLFCLNMIILINFGEENKLKYKQIIYVKLCNNLLSLLCLGEWKFLLGLNIVHPNLMWFWPCIVVNMWK